MSTPDPPALDPAVPASAASPRHWFEPAADRMGPSYLRYAHTKGTVQEVDHLVEALGLATGMRVLDVGCGPGRHAHEVARRGIACHGIDISARFVELAREGVPDAATFERADARALEYDAGFDASSRCARARSACRKIRVTTRPSWPGWPSAVRPGGRLAMTAFNAYFAVRYHTAAFFDAGPGVAHEVTEIHDEHGRPATIDLWTGCYTPRELRLLAAAPGLDVSASARSSPGPTATGPRRRSARAAAGRPPSGRSSGVRRVGVAHGSRGGARIGGHPRVDLTRGRARAAPPPGIEVRLRPHDASPVATTPCPGTAARCPGGRGTCRPGPCCPWCPPRLRHHPVTWGEAGRHGVGDGPGSSARRRRRGCSRSGRPGGRGCPSPGRRGSPCAPRAPSRRPVTPTGCRTRRGEDVGGRVVVMAAHSAVADAHPGRHGDGVAVGRAPAAGERTPMRPAR